MLKKLVILSLVLVFNSLQAQSNTGFVLLKMDVDARAAALAGAYSAVPNDASAAFWNPAGLSLAENTTINVMHNDWLWDISHSFAAVQFIQGEHNLALSVNYLQIPGIAIRGTTPTDEPAGTSEAYNLALALSYAREYEKDWHIGISVKYLFEKYYFVSAPGWALDLGLIRKNVFENLDWGITLQNIGKMAALDKQETPLPLMIRTGIAYQIPELLDNNLRIISDLLWIKDEKMYVKFGLEYAISEYLVIRSGLKNGNENLLFTAGLGINYQSFHLDYAYAPFEYDLGSSNRISVGLSF
ncbi:MAG: PorV/PorQ family protein [Calditrichae bacterium]|nr:PorV/PorQ family protein [Calditrichota bacterium]MCB9058787.1 PorV/PorQ family protein [Calditrichia bacterium]